MRITVVGAGAIGGVTGAFLKRAGHDITFVDVVPEHVQAINERGLRITGHADFTVQAPAVLASALTGPLDTVILATKALHTEAAVRSFAHLLTPDGVVLSMQNGLNPYVIAEHVGERRTLGAFLTFGANYSAPGEVVYGGPGSLQIGELDGAITPRILELQQILSALQPVAATPNIYGFLWGKMALGSIYFATATVDDDVPDQLSRPEYQPVFADLAAEVVAVALARGVEPEAFDGFDPMSLRQGARSAPAAREAAWEAQRTYWGSHVQKRTGVWRDLAVRKRQTEVDHQVGAVVRVAHELGLSIPLNEALLSQVHEIEAGTRSMSYANLAELDSLRNA